MLTPQDPNIMLYGSEPLSRDGVWMNNLTSGAYGFKIGSAVGMGYVKNEDGVSDQWVLDGKYELEVEGKMIPAVVHIRSPYDPKNQRPRM
jgi:4-methylaminobutanoate oxidase (formaldehyde-forming)